MSTSVEVTHPVEQSPVLSQAHQLTLKWVLIGAVAGILGDLAYFFSVTGLFGLKPSYYLGMAFGPLIAVAFIGFYYFFRTHKLTPTLQITIVFGIIAGAIVNMMIVVQGAQRIAVSPAAREAMGSAWEAADMVQLGLDVSWDIYLSLATVLLGVVMWKHPRFHKIFALVTVLLGAGLLLFNLWTFPIPPGSDGLVDLGPVVGGWYLVITLRVLGSRRWLAGQLVASE